MDSKDSRNNLEDALESWASLIRGGTEQKIAQSLLHSVISVSGISARFSGWLLAISGATIGLAFSNLDSVSSIATPSLLKASMLSLIFSCVAGFVSRIFGNYVELYRQIIIETTRSVTQVLKEHEESAAEVKETAGENASTPNLTPDIDQALALALSCTPRVVRWWVGKRIERSKNDPFATYKKAMAFVFLQSFSILCQVVCFGIFSILVLFSI